ncbi:MAG: hypothetical protein HQ546_11385 [Planctomycetes bacterium]|nr:hypothetical protein [Planctomycetota bacterium]
MTEIKNTRPRVIFASAGVGAGHNQVAEALLTALNQLDPSVPAERIDMLTLANPLFRLCYAGGYVLMMQRLPSLYGLGYRLTDRPSGPGRTPSERCRLWTERLAVRRYTRWLHARRPALVVNTHFLSALVIGQMIACGVQDLRQMSVVTDYHMHRYWCSEHIDCFFVPDESGRDRLVDFGIPTGRIELTGIPVHPKWSAPLTERVVRTQWNLPDDMPLVVVGGGANFTVGRIDRLAPALCRRLPNAVVAVLVGRNKKLAGRLSAEPEAQGDRPRLRAIGFTDRLHELIHVADVFVTKSGAVTVCEGLTKGTAFVLLKAVPGQEAFNAGMLCANGAAVQTHSEQEVVDQVARLLGCPSELARLRANARRLARPATEAVVARILQTVDRM